MSKIIYNGTPVNSITVDGTLVYKKPVQKFVVIGSGNAYYSDDGFSWTKVSLPGSVNAVAYGGGKFVAVSKNYCLYSTDYGHTWQQGSGLNETYSYYTIAYGNGRFVCGGTDGAIGYSFDGINWTTTWVQTSLVKGIAYGNGRFIAIGYSGLCYSSTNGYSWSRPGNSDSVIGSTSLYNITYSSELKRFIVLTSGGSSGLFYSSDGITWYKSSSSSPNFSGIVYGKDKFVSVGGNSTTAIKYWSSYSASGTNSWQTISKGSNTDSLYNVVYANGKFWATGYSDGSSGYKGRIYNSKDGLSWTLIKQFDEAFDYVAGVNIACTPDDE